ncbi:hypothetical protein ACLB2K_056363 [Fragaria x ananassa]
MEGNNQENNEEATTTDEYFRSLPPGYRFNPTDQELILYYLKPKILNQPLPRNRIHERNIYQFHPRKLSEKFKKIREDGWYFFSTRKRKYQNGRRPNRKADDGYWKATGSGIDIKGENGEVIGHKKVLDYKKGAHPLNIKTDWKMLEYKLKDEDEDNPLPKRKKGEGNMKLDLVLCKVYLNTRANGNTNNNGAITTEISDQEMVTDSGRSHYRETVLKQEADQVQPLDSSLMSSLQRQVHSNTTGAFNHMDHISTSSTIPETCFHSSHPMNNGVMVTDTVTSHRRHNNLVPKQEAGQVAPLDSSLVYSPQPQVHNNTTGGFNHLNHISNSSSSTSMSNGVYDSTNCTHYGEPMHNGSSGSVYQWGSSFTQLHHQNYYMYPEQMPSSSTSYTSEHPLQYLSTEIWTQLQPENHEMSRLDDSTFVSLPPHVREYNSMLVNIKDEAEMMPFKHEADDDDDDGLQFLSIPDEVHEDDPKTD